MRGFRFFIWQHFSQHTGISSHHPSQLHHPDSKLPSQCEFHPTACDFIYYSIYNNYNYFLHTISLGSPVSNFKSWSTGESPSALHDHIYLTASTIHSSSYFITFHILYIQIIIIISNPPYQSQPDSIHQPSTLLTTVPSRSITNPTVPPQHHSSPRHQPTAANFISPHLIAHHPDAAVRYIHPQNHPILYRTPSEKVPFYIYTGNIATLLSISYISNIQKTPYFIKMHIILYI